MGGVALPFDWSPDVFCVGAALEKERTRRRTTLETRGEATAAAAAAAFSPRSCPAAVCRAASVLESTQY